MLFLILIFVMWISIFLIHENEFQVLQPNCFRISHKDIVNKKNPEKQHIWIIC